VSAAYDVVVVGGGAAGLSCTCALQQLGLRVSLFEALALGGELGTLGQITDVPGYAPISGPDLAANLIESTLDCGAKVQYAEVTNLEAIDGYWRVNATTAAAVVWATGTEPDLTGISIPDGRVGNGVSTCASCDGPLFRDKRVAVIGSGRDAFSEAAQLATQAAAVTLLTPDKVTAPAALVHKVAGRADVVPVRGLVEIIGSPVEGVRIDTVHGITQIDVEGVFVAVDRVARSNVVTDGDQPIEVDARLAVVGRPAGLYAIGDVRAGSVRTVVAAIGDGVTAAWHLAARHSH
jgi:thioredoxin reductase (NADPH)